MQYCMDDRYRQIYESIVLACRRTLTEGHVETRYEDRTMQGVKSKMKLDVSGIQHVST